MYFHARSLADVDFHRLAHVSRELRSADGHAVSADRQQEKTVETVRPRLPLSREPCVEIDGNYTSAANGGGRAVGDRTFNGPGGNPARLPGP